MRLATSLRCAALSLAVLALSACGEDEVGHGLKTETLDSDPKGAPISVGHAVQDGDVFEATIRIQMRAVRRGKENGKPVDRDVSGSAVVKITWSFHRPGNEGPLTSRIHFSYESAEGAHAEAFLAREPVTGVLAHGSDGRARPRSIKLEGGSPHERDEVFVWLGELLLAGFGGSPSWIPPRPVQVGEAWDLESFVRPRGVDNVARTARRLGVEAPRPVFEGTARLDEVLHDQHLMVTLDALISIDGEIRKGKGSSRMSMGDRYKGTAKISAKLGVPSEFHVVHTRKQEVRSAGDHITDDITSDIRGSVVQVRR